MKNVKKLKITFKNGNILVWMYGAGLINPDAKKTVGESNVSDLTGINMRIEMVEQRSRIKVMDGAHNFLLGIRDGDESGDFEKIISCGYINFEFIKGFGSYVKTYKAAPCMINPVIHIDDPDTTVLGKYISGGQAGFAIKEFDAWTSVYIGSPAAQADVLRAIAKKAGVHLFADKDVIVYANESYGGLHTVTDGHYIVNLKDNSDVIEVFDERDIAKNVKEFEEYIPKETSRLYCLQPNKITNCLT